MTQAPFARLMLLIAVTLAIVALFAAPTSPSAPTIALSLATPHFSFSVAL